MYRISDRVSVWGSVSGGFRAPTLNELYRQFRVGALLVLANNQLGPENLVGGEAGVNLIATENVTVRGTWYINGIENPVSNVTIGTNTQQRQNLGRTKVQGFQTDAEYRLGTRVARRGRISVQRREGDRESDQPGSGRQVSRAGSAAPRVDPVRLHRSAAT